MRRLATAAMLAFALWPGAASAKVINVEFEFTPYVGDPAKSDSVVTMAGRARVFLNDIPVADEEVSAHELPVLFEDREVGPAVWIRAGSLGSVLRKGANTIRFEFEPGDAKKSYRADLRWASVTDRTTTTGDASHGTSTNQTGEGVESKTAEGKIVLERKFAADFATDRPWHHAPAITSLSEADRHELAAFVRRRVEAYKPDFSGIYALLKGVQGLDLAAVRKSRCVDQAHAAGVRIAVAKDLEFKTTGTAAVVVGAKNGPLFAPADPRAFEKIRGDDAQMCASMVLLSAYPPRLVVVKSPAGAWEPVE